MPTRRSSAYVEDWRMLYDSTTLLDLLELRVQDSDGSVSEVSDIVTE